MPPRRGGTATPPEDLNEENIVDIDVTEEMRGSYLEYAYSVIYSRALPDARDGLKPVQRRILYQMNEMGLRPDRGHVKCARVVGDVMGRLHPHGDSAIYDALVRLAQPWAMRLPLVDGHGNFGSLGGDNSAAAMRYTECRLTEAAMAMVTDIDEETVDFGPNYDGQEQEPQVLPAAIPNLLVNGTAGIAVGMATNMAPHNLSEVIAAARHLLKHPDATLDQLMRHVPGPDLPTGGLIVGLDGVREAYETGRGIFRSRATAKIEQLQARKTGIVVTELPYGIGPEKVIARIKDLVQAKKLTGISELKDLTDRNRGLHMVIEVRSGFNPEAILAELYRLTPMEETFGINNVALVDGQPRTLGLRELLTIYVDHRLEVTRRRTEFRRRKRQERLHLVDGIIVALLNIDEVIAVIRTSDDSAEAKSRLRQIFDLSEVQAQYILDTPLRRLTRFDRLELEREQDTLRAEIAELTEILENDETLRALVGGEMAELAKKFGTPRRTVLMEAGAAVTAAVPLEVGDDPCLVVLSATGSLARFALAGQDQDQDEAERAVASPQAPRPSLGAGDIVVTSLATTARATIGAVTNAGRMIRFSVLEIPIAPSGAGSGAVPSLADGHPVAEFVTGLNPGETVLALAALDGGDSAGVALGTASGIVKRVQPDYPANRDEFELIALRDDDRVIGAAYLTGDEAELVFITTDAQLLRFPASSVRPQGRQAGGMTGIRLADGASAIWFGAIGPAMTAVSAVSGMSGVSGVSGMSGVSGISGASSGASGVSDMSGVSGASGMSDVSGASGMSGVSGASSGASGISGAGGVSGPGGEAADPAAVAVVVTVAGRSGALPGAGGASVKVTPFAEYPPKGRATGGVRCQRFLKGEDGLILAWIGRPPVLAATESGVMVDLSDMQGKRDASGTALTRQLTYLGPALA